MKIDSISSLQPDNADKNRKSRRGSGFEDILKNARDKMRGVEKITHKIDHADITSLADINQALRLTDESYKNIKLLQADLKRAYGQVMKDIESKE